jgi:YVTN family beta-propeller protein
VALVDLDGGRETGKFDGPPAIRDAIFAADGKSLFVAADTLEGVAVYNTVTASLMTTISAPKVVALVRAPNGREGYALSAGPDRLILHLNLNAATLLGSQPAPNAEALFPTRTGSHLLLPDPAGGTVSIVPAQPLGRGLTLAAAPGVSLAYGAWFDMVAFIPNRARRELLLYDLDSRKAAGAIALAGTPGIGTVTPDGDKLFLPIEDSGEVVVIDANLRRRVASIAVGGIPVQAVIAGGYGLCH